MEGTCSRKRKTRSDIDERKARSFDIDTEESVSRGDHYAHAFAQFKTAHGRSYPSEAAERARFAVFRSNLQLIAVRPLGQSASWSVRRALSMPPVNPGSLYHCGTRD